jgi:transcriptional regulator with GAF, ATPase, and Fis domain
VDSAEFAEMARSLQDEPDVADTLDTLIDYARDCLSCDHAGIHLVRNREVETAAATDEVIRQADKLQTQLGEGPCLQAMWDDETFVVADTAIDTRWPTFGPKAAELGLHSILSVRLHNGEQTLGAINFYCSSVREFDRDDVVMALATARREEGLRVAIDSRHLIGQAQGILMERFGLTADKSFAVLRRYSQDKNVKLRDLAEEIVRTRQLPPESST